MVDFKIKLKEIESIYFYLFDTADNWAKPWYYTYVGWNKDASLDDNDELLKLTLYFNFAIKDAPVDIDLSNIGQIRFEFKNRFERLISEVYVDNIRLVRNVPFPTLVLRYDDIYSDINFILENISKNGLIGNLHLSRKFVNDEYTTEYIRQFYNAGWDVVNHSLSHFNFATVNPSMDIARQEVLGMKQWMEENGFVRTSNLWASPGFDVNSNLIKLLQQQQILNVDGKLDNYLCLGVGVSQHNALIVEEFTDATTNTTLFNVFNNFINHGSHGLITHLAHHRYDTYDSAMFEDYLNFIMEHFL